MERVSVIGKSPEKVSELREKILGRGFEVVDENPDLVISYGGDGMFLIAERIYPGVPKIALRDSDVGNMTCNKDICEVLDLYSSGNYRVEEIQKMKGFFKGRFEFRELIGINDVVIRNSLPTEVVRFRYRLNGGEWSPLVIGDGVVVATPYGSNKGAYFYSIVRKKFDSGLGVAFNNTSEVVEPVYFGAGDVFEVELVRGFGVLVADNNRDYINLEGGDVVKFCLTDDVARRIVLNGKD